MPQAEKSLRDYLEETSGLTTNEAISVLVDIAEALAAIESRGVVHRDIKPENILLLNDRWHIADFGIARLAEAHTAPDTHKYTNSPPYAAPEQWCGERATSATDVYALGIIAHELLTRQRPFGGPDYKDQQLQKSPPAIAGVPYRLRSLVAECLYNAPGSRPRPENLLARLKDSLKPSSSEASLLQQANALNVERLAEASRQRSAAQAEADRRGELYTVAEQVLDGVLTLVDREIKDNAPSIQIPPGISRAPHGPSFKRWELNDAAIWVDFPKATEAGRDQDLPFEVIACTTINVRGPSNHRNYLGRSHSLWYCDAQKQGLSGK